MSFHRKIARKLFPWTLAASMFFLPGCATSGPKSSSTAMVPPTAAATTLAPEQILAEVIANGIHVEKLGKEEVADGVMPGGGRVAVSVVRGSDGSIKQNPKTHIAAMETRDGFHIETTIKGKDSLVSVSGKLLADQGIREISFQEKGGKLIAVAYMFNGSIGKRDAEELEKSLVMTSLGKARSAANIVVGACNALRVKPEAASKANAPEKKKGVKAKKESYKDIYTRNFGSRLESTFVPLLLAPLRAGVVGGMTHASASYGDGSQMEVFVAKDGEIQTHTTLDNGAKVSVVLEKNGTVRVAQTVTTGNGMIHEFMHTLKTNGAVVARYGQYKMGGDGKLNAVVDKKISPFLSRAQIGKVLKSAAWDNGETLKKAAAGQNNTVKAPALNR